MLSAFLAVAAVLAGGILLIVGVVFLGAALTAVGVARASGGWPVAAAGRVVRSEIRDNRRANGLPGYRTIVRYEYEVNGEEYEGRDLAAYPLGVAVTVRYFPVEPEVAVLEPGLSFDVLYLPTMASLLLLVALAFVSWGGWRLIHVIAG